MFLMKTFAFSWWHVLLCAACAVLSLLWAGRVYRHGGQWTPAERASRRREGLFILIASLGLAVSSAGALVSLAHRRVEAALATACAVTAAAALALGLRWLKAFRTSGDHGRPADPRPPAGRVAVAAFGVLVADAALILALVGQPTAQTVGLAVFGVLALVAAMLYLAGPKP